MVMNVAATRMDLNRFLELKKATEKRLTSAPEKSEAVKPVNSKEGGVASFLDLIRELKGAGSVAAKASSVVAPTVSAPAQVARPMMGGSVQKGSTVKATGLLAAYGPAFEAAVAAVSGGASEAPEKTTRNLGNFFDSVA